MIGVLGAGSKEMAEEFVGFVDKHHLRPPIAETYGFEEADKALKAAAKLSGAGKVVVRC